MLETPKICDVLVVDSGGFIKNADLRSMADKEVVTLRDVVTEIRDKATKQRLQTLPYDLIMKEPDSEDLTHVTNFAKKTGDYPSLSATDLKVIALAFGLEKQLVGSVDHLNSEPKMKPTVNYYKPGQSDNPVGRDKLAGFYEGGEDDDEEDDEVNDDPARFNCFNFWREPLPDIEEQTFVNLELLDKYFSDRSYTFGYTISEVDLVLLQMLEASLSSSVNDYHHLSRWQRHIKSWPRQRVPPCPRASTVLDAIYKMAQENSEDESAQNTEVFEKIEQLGIEDTRQDNEEQEEIEADSTEEEEDDDDDGWITPANIKAKKREVLGLNGPTDDEVKQVKVACLTTDFAMQNVLKQLGLNVVSVDGVLIKEVKTWILRCYACYKTTTLMEKKFCPKCGNKTLKRVSCTLNPDGTTQIYISTRRPLSKRGTKFSLPAPKGGKHALNPILCEDQHLPQQRQTRLARQKTDALSEDYIAGNSPFVMHDVTSRSARMGVPGKGAKSNVYWMKKNPNEGTRRTGNRRKKNVL